MRSLLYAPLHRSFWRTLLYITTGTTALNHSVGVHRISGQSMAPTLSPDTRETGLYDWVLFRKRLLLFRARSADNPDGEHGWLKPGMIVTFRAPHDPEKMAVKRVVAQYGDVVKPLKRKTPGLIRAGADLKDSNDIAPVTIPYGHVWVEGDNAEKSRDSNDYGPISIALVDGVGLAVVWPSVQSRRGRIDDWESGDWKKRLNGRIQWSKASLQLPEEWVMQS